MCQGGGRGRIDRRKMLTDLFKKTGDESPFRLCPRIVRPEGSVVEVRGAKIGGGHFAVIAGPCAVESEEQIYRLAAAVKAAGADFLRGGAFKPRTCPYDFQGLGGEGLKMLVEAGRQAGIPVVSECMGVEDIPLFRDVDVLQVGARNMQNYELLKAVGRSAKPVLLKRGIAATLREFLLSAEYIMAEGNGSVILCERGIRTFDDYTRNTLDLAAVSLLRELTHLPVIVDPSHATGMAKLVPSMSLAAAAGGCDGLMIEVHEDPSAALSDGEQAIEPGELGGLIERVLSVRRAAASVQARRG